MLKSSARKTAHKGQDKNLEVVSLCLLNMLFDFPDLKTWPWPLEKQALGRGWWQYFWGPNTCVQVNFTSRWGRADGEGAEANPGTGGEAEEEGQC